MKTEYLKQQSSLRDLQKLIDNGLELRDRRIMIDTGAE